jgi:hypothetical protein
MNKTEKLFYAIGTNPKVFFLGWLTAIISVFLGLLVIHFQ